MSRRKQTSLPFLLVLAFASAIFVGFLIQVRRPDIGVRATAPFPSEADEPLEFRPL